MKDAYGEQQRWLIEPENGAPMPMIVSREDRHAVRVTVYRNGDGPDFDGYAQLWKGGPVKRNGFIAFVHQGNDHADFGPFPAFELAESEVWNALSRAFPGGTWRPVGEVDDGPDGVEVDTSSWFDESE